ncbi:MAG: CooT family nickel-binding protein [Ignisphaera sp.]
MCESKVYLMEDGKMNLVAEEVVSMVPKGNGYVFIDITGRRYELENVNIEYIDFVQHKVVLKKIVR